MMGASASTPTAHKSTSDCARATPEGVAGEAVASMAFGLRLSLRTAKHVVSSWTTVSMMSRICVRAGSWYEPTWVSSLSATRRNGRPCAPLSASVACASTPAAMATSAPEGNPHMKTRVERMHAAKRSLST